MRSQKETSTPSTTKHIFSEANPTMTNLKVCYQ